MVLFLCGTCAPTRQRAEASYEEGSKELGRTQSFEKRKDEVRKKPPRPKRREIPTVLTEVSAVVEDAAKTKRKERQLNYIFKDALGVLYISNYILLNHIDRGSFGTVKLSLNVNSGSLEAVKVVRSVDFEKLWSMPWTEYKRFVLRLNHPNLVKHNNVIEDNETQFVVTFMEYVDGGPLMKEDFYTLMCKPMSQRRAKLYFIQMLQGLSYLHERGIIHGDLTLRNMLLSGETVKICNMDSAAYITMMQRKRTTPAYCAPEIIRGTSKTGYGYSYKSDIYAIGVCLYAMLHGRLPYASMNKYQIYKEISEGREIEYHKALPESVIALLKGMLEKNPEKRFDMKTVLGSSWVRMALLKNILIDSFNTEPMMNQSTKSQSQIRVFNKGEYLFKKGDLGNTVMFILSGDVQALSFEPEEHFDDIEDVPDENTLLDGETYYDLEFQSCSKSMDEQQAHIAKKLISKMYQQGMGTNTMVMRKGECVGEISALKSLSSRDKNAKAERVATCRALNTVKVMECHVRMLSMQCIVSLKDVVKRQREVNKVVSTSKDLEKLYYY